MHRASEIKSRCLKDIAIPAVVVEISLFNEAYIDSPYLMNNYFHSGEIPAIWCFLAYGSRENSEAPEQKRNTSPTSPRPASKASRRVSRSRN